MSVGIITGTLLYEIPGLVLQEQVVETPYGKALVQTGPLGAATAAGAAQLVFLARHGLRHDTPPHRINYRANLMAMQQLGVDRILAANAVGSINLAMPPLSLVALSDFIDFTSGRENTFFDGGRFGVTHVDMSASYCPALRSLLCQRASALGLRLHPQGVYACTNGPRLETPAEVRMEAALGADVVGMTGVPEATLARELGIHYAAVGFSVNWAAGINPKVEFVYAGLKELQDNLLALFLDVLQLPLPAASAEARCSCQERGGFIFPPQE